MASLQTLAAATSLLALAHERLGPGLTGFEIMNTLSLDLVRTHFAHLRQPLAAAPWTVLVEHSDAEDQAHATATLESLLGTAMERGLVDDAGIRQQPRAGQRDVAHPRDDSARPGRRWRQRQARHRAADLGDRRVRRRHRRAVTKAFPGARLVDFGHLGDGNLHYNVQGPPGDADFVARFEKDINALVYEAVAARGGSISAEHGIGELKRDELVERKSPVALDMMRAIKNALDPAGVLNPGRVLRPPATP
jgi:FAD/FMN-containing dehydrogenase